MAIAFDSSSAYFNVPDAAGLTLSASTGWTVVDIIRIPSAVADNNSGSTYQYFHSRGNYAATNSLNHYFYQYAGVDFDYEYRCFAVDSGGRANDALPSEGTLGHSVSNEDYGADGVWRLVVLRFNTSTKAMELVLCDVNGSAVAAGTYTNASFSDVNGGAIKFGCRADLNADRIYHGELYRSLQFGAYLSNAEIEHIASNATGYPAGKTPEYDFVWEDSATVVDETATYTATRNGTLAGTVSDPSFSSDSTAPTLTSPSGTETGSSTASGSVSTDEGNGTLYAVVTQSVTAPSVAQIQAGQDHTESAADYGTSQAVSATGTQNVSATGLSASTTYYWHFQQEDAATNDSTVVTSASFTTDASDTTAPVLSSATGVATGPTTADGSVSTDEGNGTLYAVLTTSATTPSVAQVQAGLDHTGSAAVYDTSQAVSATGTQNVSATGLSAESTYYWHFQHEDAAANDSTVATSAGLTTPATVTLANTFCLGNANPSTLTIDWAVLNEPVIRFGFYQTKDSTQGSRTLGRAAKLTGMDGLTPEFRLIDDPSGWGNNHDTLWYSYAEDGPYFELDTTRTDGADYAGFKGASAFTGDAVYLWSALPHTTGFIATWVADLFSTYSSVMHRTASDIAFTTDTTTGVVAQVAGSTTYWGKSIPTLPQYGFRLSDDTTSPTGGKRIAVMIGHQHAGEYTGVHHLRAFVDWLVSGATEANQLLDDFEFFIYPQVNVNGSYGGHFRATFEDQDGDPAGTACQDPNRDWDKTTSALTSVQNIKSAIETDVGQQAVNLFFDHHSYAADSNPALYVAASDTEATSLMGATNGYDSEFNASPLIDAFGDSAATWANPAVSTDGYFTSIDISGTLEFSQERGYDEADMTRLASAWGKALNDRMSAGDYAPAGGGAHETTGSDALATADADTAAISQTHGNLAASDAEGAADADTAAATQDHQLAGDDIEAQAAPDTGAVDQAGTLAADDAEAQADPDTAAASQDHQLAGADIEAQADPDTGAAQQAGVLTADPAEATADADTAAASQDHDLAGTDIEAATDADTGAVDGSATTAADDIEARADADTGAVTVIHKPAAADAEGQAAMDAAAAGQVHQLGGDDPEARGDIPAGGLLLDGIGAVFSPQLLDVTLRTYLIDPHNPTGAPK